MRQSHEEHYRISQRPGLRNRPRLGCCSTAPQSPQPCRPISRCFPKPKRIPSALSDQPRQAASPRPRPGRQKRDRSPNPAEPRPHAKHSKPLFSIKVFHPKARRNCAVVTRPSIINNMASKSRTETIQNPYRTHTDSAQISPASVQLPVRRPAGQPRWSAALLSCSLPYSPASACSTVAAMGSSLSSLVSWRSWRTRGRTPASTNLTPLPWHRVNWLTSIPRPAESM